MAEVFLPRVGSSISCSSMSSCSSWWVLCGLLAAKHYLSKSLSTRCTDITNSEYLCTIVPAVILRVPSDTTRVNSTSKQSPSLMQNYLGAKMLGIVRCVEVRFLVGDSIDITPFHFGHKFCMLHGGETNSIILGNFSVCSM